MAINQFPEKPVDKTDIKVTSTAPSNPEVGDIWIDNSQEVLNTDLVTSKISGPNLLHNGAMRVSQRYGTSGVSFGSGGGTKYYGVDRFFLQNYTWSAGSNITASQETSIVPPSFTNSLKVSTGATGLTFASGGFLSVTTRIEGYNLAPYYNNYLTLSFWVRSSTAGLYNLYFTNRVDANDGDANQRRYTPFYTINNANTWEKKTITLNMATATAAGIWDKTNENGLAVSWVLGAHSDRSGTTYQNDWQTTSTYAIRNTDSINWATFANQTFFITGIQLEVGSRATDFQFKDYATELRECQRYYETGRGMAIVVVNADNAACSLSFKVTKRNTPAISFSNEYQIASGSFGPWPSYAKGSCYDINGCTNISPTSANSYPAVGTGFQFNFAASAEL